MWACPPYLIILKKLVLLCKKIPSLLSVLTVGKEWLLQFRLTLKWSWCNRYLKNGALPCDFFRSFSQIVTNTWYCRTSCLMRVKRYLGLLCISLTAKLKVFHISLKKAYSYPLPVLLFSFSFGGNRY